MMNKSIDTSALPPGPSFPLLQTMRFSLDPFGAYPKWLEEYGDPFTVRMIIGPMVVTGDPEHVKTIFAADPDDFDVFGADSVNPLAGIHSVSVVSGEDHRFKRKLLMPPFHASHLGTYARMIREVADKYSGRLRAGEPMVIHQLNHLISLEVMVRLVVNPTTQAEIDHCAAVVDRFIASFTPSITMIHALRRNFLGLGPWAKFQRANAALDEMLYSTIRKRRAEDRKDDDIITLLLGARYDDETPMSDHEIRDQLITLMFAGNETTAAALTWAFHWLFHNDGPRQRLLDELAPLGRDPEPEALAKLPYLQAVCHESLRLRPIVPHVLRLLKKPLRLGAHELPAGAALDASVILLHRREDLYPDSQQFRPERFLDRKFAPNEFMPFGGAARRCLGATFALYEMKIVLGTLMARHRFEPRGEREVRSKRHGLVMIPSHRVPVTVAA